MPPYEYANMIFTHNQTGAISDSLLEAHSHGTLVIARMAVGVPTDPKSNHSIDSRREINNCSILQTTEDKYPVTHTYVAKYNGPRAWTSTPSSMA
jgi:hypothetical protein